MQGKNRALEKHKTNFSHAMSFVKFADIRMPPLCSTFGRHPTYRVDNHMTVGLSIRNG